MRRQLFSAPTLRPATAARTAAGAGLLFGRAPPLGMPGELSPPPPPPPATAARTAAGAGLLFGRAHHAVGDAFGFALVRVSGACDVELGLNPGRQPLPDRI